MKFADVPSPIPEKKTHCDASIPGQLKSHHITFLITGTSSTRFLKATSTAFVHVMDFKTGQSCVSTILISGPVFKGGRLEERHGQCRSASHIEFSLTALGSTTLRRGREVPRFVAEYL